jgi:hypothetical protein
MISSYSSGGYLVVIYSNFIISKRHLTIVFTISSQELHLLFEYILIWHFKLSYFVVILCCYLMLPFYVVIAFLHRQNFWKIPLKWLIPRFLFPHCCWQDLSWFINVICFCLSFFHFCSFQNRKSVLFRFCNFLVVIIPHYINIYVYFLNTI